MLRKLNISVLLILGFVVVVTILTLPKLLIDNNEEQSYRQSTIDAVFATNTAVVIAVQGTRAAKAAAPGSDQNVSQQATPERIVIKNAVLRLVVDHPSNEADTISQMADAMSGWVVTSSTTQTRLRSGEIATQATITIRIPSERLNEALSRIKANAISVDSETVTGQDVTQDYVDTLSRITNLEAAEAQLRKIMDGAGRTEDVLNVYQELVRVRGDIETAKGRIQYFRQASAYSSIDVTLLPNEQDKPFEVAGWRPLDTAKNAFAALINVAQVLVNIVIWLAIFVLPFVIVFGVPGLLIWRVYSRRQRARKAVLDEVFQTPPPEPHT